jgi:DNA-binding CsgD family transcriptional regulator
VRQDRDRLDARGDAAQDRRRSVKMSNPRRQQDADPNTITARSSGMETETDAKRDAGRVGTSAARHERSPSSARFAAPVAAPVNQSGNQSRRAAAKAVSMRPSEPFRPSLTPREQEALRMLANGYSADDVGRCLGITTNTVRAHMKHVRYKLAATSTAQAVYTAQKLGMI